MFASVEPDCLVKAKELHAAGNIVEAAEICEKLPCSEISDCQRFVGWFYFERGNLQKSHCWYSKAALQGNAEALSDSWKVILQIDANGDKQTAMDLCEIPPCSEYLECQRYLANAFFSKGDIENTLRWSRKVADHGGAEDLAYVGILYRSRNEPALAIDFFKRAIAAGSIRANHLLGDLLAFGMGIPRDVQAAIPYYERSASYGLILGKLRLLHFRRVKSRVVLNIAFLAHITALFAKVLVLKIRNPRDPRLVDM